MTIKRPMAKRMIIMLICVAVLTGHPLFDPNVVPGASAPGEAQVAGPPEPRSATSAPSAPGLAVPPASTGAGRAAAFLGSRARPGCGGQGLVRLVP